MTTELRRIQRWKGGRFETLEDEVIVESALTVTLNGEELVTLMSLGTDQRELGLGFLRSEGFLCSRDQLQEVEEADGRLTVRADVDLALLRKLAAKRTVTTGCGAGTAFHRPLDALTLKPVESAARFEPATLLARMKEMEQASELFRRTGGVHNAALADADTLLFMRSDIGRHNAVDMLGGRALLDDLDLSDKALLVSGRISSEILRKTAAMGIGVLVSRSAPTGLALTMAETLRVTVVGYARAGRLNLYTGPERLLGAGAPPPSPA